MPVTPAAVQTRRDSPHLQGWTLVDQPANGVSDEIPVETYFGSAIDSFDTGSYLSWTPLQPPFQSSSTSIRLTDFTGTVAEDYSPVIQYFLTVSITTCLPSATQSMTVIRRLSFFLFCHAPT